MVVGRVLVQLRGVDRPSAAIVNGRGLLLRLELVLVAVVIAGAIAAIVVA